MKSCPHCGSEKKDRTVAFGVALVMSGFAIGMLSLALG